MKGWENQTCSLEAQFPYSGVCGGLLCNCFTEYLRRVTYSLVFLLKSTCDSNTWKDVNKNVWMCLVEDVGLLLLLCPTASDQWQGNFCPILALLTALIDILRCPDLHRPVNKYCAGKSMEDWRRELHISLFLWADDIITQTKNTLESCQISSPSVPVPLPSFLSCVMWHILGCKQPQHWLRTSLASLCRNCHITLDATLDCEHKHTNTHTCRQTLPKPAQPSGYWKVLSPWSSWLV